MTGNYGVPDELMTMYAQRAENLKKIGQEISRVALANCGVKEGDVMVHRETGLSYKIVTLYAYVTETDGVCVTITALRYYKSGRRQGKTARTSSHIRLENLEHDTSRN